MEREPIQDLRDDVIFERVFVRIGEESVNEGSVGLNAGVPFIQLVWNDVHGVNSMGRLEDIIDSF